MRHFEKKGRLRLFRRVGTRGSTLKLELGAAAEGMTTVSEKHSSPAAARAAAGVWCRWALEAGFAEVALERGLPGVVYSPQGPAGPCRVRTDAREDVYCAKGAALLPALEIGQRVVVEGVRRHPGLEVAFMFGSELEARRVVAFPEPRWSQFKAREDLSEKARRPLVALAGPALLGHARRERPLAALRPGSLIFAFEKGVHRYLKTVRVKGTGALVHYEPVLTSQLKRQSFHVLTCLADFCEPVPAELRRELERLLGLGLKPERSPRA